MLHAPVMSRYLLARQVCGHFGGSMCGRHPDARAMAARRASDTASAGDTGPDAVATPAPAPAQGTSNAVSARAPASEPGARSRPAPLCGRPPLL